jgi:hypothetical protein
MDTYYQRNKERYLTRQKKYNLEHKEEIKEYQKQYWLTKKKPKIHAIKPPTPRTRKPPPPPKLPKPPKLPPPPNAPVLLLSEPVIKPEPEPLPPIVIERGIVRVSFK